MESEDIIATHPDTQNTDDDNKNSLILNGTLLSDTQNGVKTTVGLTNFTSSKSSFGSVNHNKKSSNLSFQDSRTPFSKRLEMLRQGISSKPSVMIPMSLSGEHSSANAELSQDTNRLTELNVKEQEDKTITNHPNVSKQLKDVSQSTAETEETLASGMNSESTSDDEKDNYLGKRLFIDEENVSESEPNSNKRTRLSSPEDASTSNQSFFPVAPIPTILSQTSEEEKPNVKSKSSGRPVRKTRGKRKIDK